MRMIRREILKLLPLAFISSCTVPPVQPSLPRQSGPQHGFTAVHLEAAVKLQAMPSRQRIRALRAMARTYDQTLDHFIWGNPSKRPDPFVLCRMLFVPRRDGAAFRQPGIGAFFYPGGTTSADWPLTPVALIDGAPFYVVSGRICGAPVEPASRYLEFVLRHCDWTSFRYRRLSRAARMAACQSLLRSPVWKQPLADDEQTRFLEQAV
jgi:hypothetical protein